MSLHRKSGCKINLLLNILGKRPDGFHELETILQPVPLFDELELARRGEGVELEVDGIEVPTGRDNLIVKAAELFLETVGISEGLRIRLKKNIPMAAGLGGGSGNAAQTLSGLNELFDHPLDDPQIQSLAAQLGSDVPFFLQQKPALAIGRGEAIQVLAPFPALETAQLLLVKPEFGVPTAWAYGAMKNFPERLQGDPGRKDGLLSALNQRDLFALDSLLYNALEGPVLRKFPILKIYQSFLREHGAKACLLSGSGSTTFALFDSAHDVAQTVDSFLRQFGEGTWHWHGALATHSGHSRK